MHSSLWWGDFRLANVRSWEIDDPLVPLGRRFNDMRRKLEFAKSEVKRLSDYDSDILTTFYALQNEIALIENELNTVHETLYSWPSLVINGVSVMDEIGHQAIENTITDDDSEVEISETTESQQKLDRLSMKGKEWIDSVASVILNDFPKALQVESYIDVLSEHIPLVLHRFIHQKQDPLLSKALGIPMNLLQEMMDRLGLSSNILLVTGTEFSVIRLRAIDEVKNQFIVIMPFSRYQDIFGWIPLGHEAGHIFFKHLEDGIQMSLQPLVIDKIGPFFNPYWILKWCEEIFCDIVMAEFFLSYAILDLDTMQAFERQLYIRDNLIEIVEALKDTLDRMARDYVDDTLIDNDSDDNEDETNQETDDCNLAKIQTSEYGTHPPPILRISLMLDYLKSRLSSDKGIENLRIKHQDSIVTQSSTWPFPWCDSDFRTRLGDIIRGYVNSTGIQNKQKDLPSVFSDILDNKSLEKYDFIEIILSLSIGYVQQFHQGFPKMKDEPERVYQWLLQKSSSE